MRLRLAAAIFALATIPLGALVAIEAQLSLITAGLVVMLALPRADTSADTRADTAAEAPVQAAGE